MVTAMWEQGSVCRTCPLLKESLKSVFFWGGVELFIFKILGRPYKTQMWGVGTYRLPVSNSCSEK